MTKKEEKAPELTPEEAWALHLAEYPSLETNDSARGIFIAGFLAGREVKGK